ncbi:MAG TPA: hypothetical protein VF105_03640 [Gemmatimonadaceae bacterium]
MRRPVAIAAVIAAVTVFVVFFAFGARTNRYEPEPVRAENAVGDPTCLSCHNTKATFETTAHRLTSRSPTPGAIIGAFQSPENVLRTSNPRLYFRMDSTPGGFYQTAVFGERPDTTVRSEHVDIVTGSGRRGQSFLYWRGDRLYQLPVSHWTILGWANSPAYPDGRANFDRPIPPRCLECHMAAAQSISEPNNPAHNRYVPQGLMLGLMCETCHGSGKEHVKRERSVLHPVLGPAIINPARLSRSQRIDACALCHGGAIDLQSTPFTFVPGQKYVKKNAFYAPPTGPQVDVHGDQVGQLERSKCFAASQMTCLTCHDVHRVQHNVEELSGRCLSCHTTRSCGLFPTYGNALAGKCVSCHMPKLPSLSVISNYGGRAVRQPIRAHWIKIYPEFNTLAAIADSTKR